MNGSNLEMMFGSRDWRALTPVEQMIMIYAHHWKASNGMVHLNTGRLMKMMLVAPCGIRRARKTLLHRGLLRQICASGKKKDYYLRDWFQIVLDAPRLWHFRYVKE